MRDEYKALLIILYLLYILSVSLFLQKLVVVISRVRQALHITFLSINRAEIRSERKGCLLYISW